MGEGGGEQLAGPNEGVPQGVFRWMGEDEGVDREMEGELRLVSISRVCCLTALVFSETTPTCLCVCVPVTPTPHTHTHVAGLYEPSPAAAASGNECPAAQAVN